MGVNKKISSSFDYSNVFCTKEEYENTVIAHCLNYCRQIPQTGEKRSQRAVTFEAYSVKREFPFQGGCIRIGFMFCYFAILNCSTILKLVSTVHFIFIGNFYNHSLQNTLCHELVLSNILLVRRQPFMKFVKK